MPGTNHEIESGFMDSLSFSLRPAATDLLMHYRLKQLLQIRKGGPYPELTRRFDLTPAQWLTVTDAVILTKLTYFQIHVDMTNEHLDLMHEAAANSLLHPGMSLQDMYQKTEMQYGYFAQFVLKLIEVRRLKENLKK